MSSDVEAAVRRPCMGGGRRRASGYVVLACIVALGIRASGEQLQVPSRAAVPQTGGARQLWPQRPVARQPLLIDVPPLPAEPQSPQVAGDEPRFVPDEVLVQFQADASDDDRAVARAAVSAVQGRTMRANGGRLERLTTTLAVSDAIAILQSLPQVEFAEPNWLVHHAATSNDPYYTGNLLWGMYGNNTTPANQFGSQAGEAWAAGFTGSNGVYVAVLDEGIDFNHPDLSPNIWTNPFDPIDGVDNDGNGKVDDIHGWDFRDENNSVYDGSPAQPGIDNHGTHVAGTIGARGGNGVGVAGVSWNVTIISGKFIGPGNQGTAMDAARALDYITDLKLRHGLNIVATNNSWTINSSSIAVHEAIIRSAKQGILFVAAAGNSGADSDSAPSYPSAYSSLVAGSGETPASYESVIAVASIDMSGAKSSFSNYGLASVDLGAPGSNINSTLPQGGYGQMSGTSMATPHVTGAAALYKSIYPTATAAQIREALLLQGVATPSLAGLTVTGKRLNAGDFNSSLSLSINDVRLTEGNSGTKNATFTVSMSGSSGSPVAVNYVTQNVTAVSGASSHSNTAAIAIPASGAGSPYPSTIVVPAGLGSITNVRVTLAGVSHAAAADVDVLLVGPAGQTCVLMSDISGSAASLTFTFDDAGPVMPAGALVSGTYRPTNSGAGDSFTGPAPPGPHGATLSLFNGTDPAGSWRLFVVDDAAGVGGSITGGWTLSLATAPADYAPAEGTLTFPAGATSQTVSVAVNGDIVVEATETFTVVLSGALGASVVDAEGIATVVNDDFTDPSLSGLPVKAVHIAELRTAINEARALRGLSGFAFTMITATQTPIRAAHINELRTALAQAYSAASLAPPVYTDQTIVPGVTIVKAAHLAEIRNAVVALLSP